LNAPRGDGASPLFVAAEKGNAEVVNELLSRGAAIDTSNNNGATPLYVAAYKGHAGVVKELLSRGAAVDTPTRFGWTPLLASMARGHTNIARMLLGPLLLDNFRYAPRRKSSDPPSAV
jgi:ankyrin repeat protein